MAADNLRVQVLFAAIDKLTGPLKGMGAGSRGLKTEIASTRKELQALQKAQGSSNAFRKSEADLEALGAKVKAARLEHKAYRDELARVDKVTAAQTRKLEQLATAEAKAGAAFQAQSDKVKRLGADLQDAGVDIADLGAHQDRLARDIQDANRRLDQQTAALERNAKAQARVQKAQELGARMRDTGAKAIAAGSAVAAPLVLAGKSAATFESKLTDIGQKANLSRNQVAAMGREFDRMGPKVAQVPLALAEGVDVLMGFGLGQKQALEAIRPIGTAATAYKAEIVDLAAATFASLDNLKVPAQQTGKTLDIMAKAGKAGAFEIKDMAQHFPALTASANALGQKGVGAVADLAAALQITRKGAGDSATAANNLQNLLDKINTKDAIDNFAKFGINLPAAMKKAAREGRSPIEEIVGLTKKATGGDLSKLSFLFADSQVQAALRPLVQNMGLYRQIRADALKAQGDVEADFNERLKDSATKWERLKAAAQTTAHVVGGALLPVLNPVMDKISAIGEASAQWAQKNPALVQLLAKVAAVMAVVLIGAGALAIGLGAVVGPFAMLRFSFGQALPLLRLAVPVFTALRTAALFLARGVLQAGAMMLANPVVLAIVAIGAAIGVAAYLVWKHWDTIKGAFSAAGTWIMTKLGQLKAFFLRYPALFGPIGEVVAFVINHWDRIKGVFSAASAWLGTKLGQLKDLFFRFPAIFGPIGAVAGFVMNHWGQIKASFGAAGEWLATKLGQIRDLMLRYPGVFGLLGMAVRAVMGHWSAIKGAFGAGLSYLLSLPGRMASIGANIIQGLINGVTGKLGQLRSTITGAASSAASWFRQKLEIRSPSRVFMRYGGFITEGLARGIGAGEGRAFARVDRLASRIAGVAAAGSLAAASPLAANARPIPPVAVKPVAVAPITPPRPVSAAPANTAVPNGGGVTIQNLTINLTQAPGEDGAALARRMMDELAKLKAGASRSSFSDED